MFLVNALSLIILFVIICLYFESKNGEITHTKSTVDGKEYFVRNLPDKIDAANNIALVKQKFNKLVQYLKTEYVDDNRVKFLVENYQEDVLSEAPADSQNTSYSINKGESIYFCLRQRDKANRLIDLNTVTFVALHELAHLMTTSIGHEPDFWKNFEFILKNAIKIGIYQYQPFHVNPVPYCGTMISDTPLKL